MTPPVALPGGPYNADEGAAVQLDASASSDALSGIAQIDWAVNPDSVFNDPNPAGFIPPDGPAVYDVPLRVLDLAGNEAIVSASVHRAERRADRRNTVGQPGIDDDGGRRGPGERELQRPGGWS